MATMEASCWSSSVLNVTNVTEELVETILAPVLWLVAIKLNHKVTVTEDENLQGVVEETDIDGVAANGVSNACLKAITLEIFNLHNKICFMLKIENAFKCSLFNAQRAEAYERVNYLLQFHKDNPCNRSPHAF
jgi:hypothetical protein